MSLTPDANPMVGHRYENDPLSGGAIERMVVGGREMIAIADGFFSMTHYPEFLGSPEHPTAGAEHLVAEYGGEPRLPVGAVLVPGETITLIDAGVGPVDAGGAGALVGGLLLARLEQLGVRPEDIDVLALTHLHLDHMGWLADTEGHPTFPNAKVHFGQADWEYFVEGEPHGMGLEPYLRAGLEELDRQGRIVLHSGDADIAPGVRRIDAAGHTPGHSIYAVHDGSDRAMVLGDAVYCPAQLTGVDWSAMSDVDPQLARRTRERLTRELEDSHALGLGCHFPGLRAGRVVGGEWRLLA